jgi:hypothetical protein
MEAKASFLHQHIGPNASNEVLLANDLPCTVDKCDKQVQCPTSQPNRYSIPLEEAF